ncbi:hypothetical protein SGM_0616 [Streptomyces griseoaurantiacus M045]|uniref:Uncharacterized protein n=1 Tax=Streptomyces griseoaurantiacus M045 TaxID=996637 RepID=F3NB82_9ACTN|nr:hypothetical protein SGM_0616 [Streptomyces griseoaurantiacus M045]
MTAGFVSTGDAADPALLAPLPSGTVGGRGAPSPSARRSIPDGGTRA